MKNLKTLVLGAAFMMAALPAMAELVVVVHPNSPAASMTNDQVAQVFLGKSTEMKPVDQPESAPIRSEFYKKVTDKEASQAKAHWAKMVFTGKATLPKEVGSSADVKKAVAADPKAIGYIEKSAVDSTVKTVLTAP
jgi:ABC-type phosphate transport system substrate-binding protein